MEIFYVVFIVEISYLIVYFCCLVNDGIVIKLVIEFDEWFKENVGLIFNIDIDYVRKNFKLSVDFLKKNFVIEVIVFFVISIDNKCSLFCVVEYFMKFGKMVELFYNVLIE